MRRRRLRWLAGWACYRSSLMEKIMSIGLIFCSLWACVGFTLLATSGAAAAAALEDESFLENAYYANQSQLEAELFEVVSTYPSLARVYGIGASTEGRELWVVNLRTNITRDRPLLVPSVKYVGNIHGDEILGRQMLIYFVKYLLYNYASSAEIRQLLDTTDLHVLPSMNPDGFARAPIPLCHLDFVTDGRTNAHRKDLNRNFPNRLSSRKLNLLRREPEVAAVVRWSLARHFVLSANFHGGAIVASYAYDNRAGANGSTATADDAVFRHLALTYAQNHRLMYTGHNCDLGEVFANGTTNGGDWYLLDGGMQDFNYDYANCLEVTLEISCCKGPPASTLADEWANNKHSLMEFVRQAHIGVRGVVVDKATGRGIAGAAIVVKNNAKAMSTTKRGEYWRLLMPGNYQVHAEAPGYKNSEAISIKVPKVGYVMQNFTLVAAHKKIKIN